MYNNKPIDGPYLLERASRCRRLAQQALSERIADELEKLACDYDRDAAQIGAVVPPVELI